jgi:hypothetical protein
MIHGQNADGINVFPILHHHVPLRFNAFLPTERHQSLATAKLIVDTDRHYLQPAAMMDREAVSLSLFSPLHFRY